MTGQPASGPTPPQYSSWDEVPLTLTLDHVAELLSVSRSSAYRLVRDGRIRCVYLSARRIRISKDEMLRFLGVSEDVSNPGNAEDGATEREHC